MYANDSDNDGDDLCVEVVGPSWNPEGVAMPTSFTNAKAILSAVDNLVCNTLIKIRKILVCFAKTHQ